jgi:hypothetical protein
MPVIRRAGSPTIRPHAVVVLTASAIAPTHGTPCMMKNAWA